MCRLAGIINPQLEKNELHMLVQSMCDSLKHGGPDDEGIYQSVSCNTVIGHRRLSIIDISDAGHQPMQYASGRFVVSYNGELYNYRELKMRLVNEGCSFKTNSDTEVIVAAYAQWGVKCLHEFSGMFAFAIWDEEAKEFLLARDGAGIKPLYYAYTKEGFAFASEVRAFKNVPYLCRENPGWKVYFMAYGHLPEPITTLQKVMPLQKGNYLVYNARQHSIKIESFYKQRFIEKIGNRKAAIELITDGFNEAIKKHLIADAPIGVFLSGGLDSSVVAALADKHKANMQAVSIYFDNSHYSEKKFQDDLQAKLSFHHRQFLLSENEFHGNLESVMQAMDLPSCDGINTWFISKYARECGLKAVLSGVGGDELFGGYPSFKRIKTVLALEQLPASLLKKGRYSKTTKFRRLAFLSLHGAVGEYLFLRGQFIPGDIARLLNADETEIWEMLTDQPRLPNIDYLSSTNRASWLETNLYMQNQLLRDADVMSMAHGLELRVPFLDKEFMDTVLKIKSAIKFSGKYTKQLLIDAFKDQIPDSIWKRPKMGFAFPFKEWFSNDIYAGALKIKAAEKYHQQLKHGQMHWSKFLILMLISNNNNA